MTTTTRQRAELISATMLAPGVRLLSLRTDKPFPFVAGQWLKILMEGDVGEFRAYSIASPPGVDAESQRDLEIAVTRVEDGPVSNRLHELSVGSELEIDGPWGVFTLDRAPAEAFRLFVGTGTGVTPLRSMLQTLAREEPMFRATLLFGCRTEQDALFVDEFEALTRNNANFSFEVTFSQPRSPDVAPRTGYVQTHLKEILSPHPGAHVFVCGRSEMVKGVRAVLKGDLGYERKRIHSERYD